MHEHLTFLSLLTGNLDVDLKPEFNAIIDNMEIRQFALENMKTIRNCLNGTDEKFFFYTKCLYQKDQIFLNNLVPFEQKHN